MNIPGLIAAINILLQSWAVVSRNYQRQTFLEHESPAHSLANEFYWNFWAKKWDSHFNIAVPSLADVDIYARGKKRPGLLRSFMVAKNTKILHHFIDVDHS